ncbi:hypothetical protein, partial [uncultured Clostridium sp.]|uniref:hypothetical protein n=1 Tax=uncultured Clostridium sp. TaxID=59620 RepID=UPI0026054A74
MALINFSGSIGDSLNNIHLPPIDNSQIQESNTSSKPTNLNNQENNLNISILEKENQLSNLNTS